VPPPEDDAQVRRVPGEEHLKALDQRRSVGGGECMRTFMLHRAGPSIPPWSMPPWSMCE
jgi:hypothetical protein